MNKTKVKEIIKFSFFHYFHNKWFVIFNLISLICLVLSLNWSNIADLLSINDDSGIYSVKVLDSSNLVFDKLLFAFSGDKNLSFEKIEENTYTKENIEDDIIVLEINKDNNEYFNATLISKEGIKREAYEKIEKSLNLSKSEYLKKEYHFSDSTLEKIQKSVSIERIMLAVDAENSDQKEIIKTISSALTYMIAVLVFTRIANEIAQEKQSKSSEYILTSVSGKEYLFAKVFSNIAILIIQFLLIFSYYLLSAGILSLFKIASTDISLAQSANISGLGKDIVLYMITLIVLNVLSFTLLSIIQGTLAAKTGNSQEAGNTVSILIFVMMILYALTLFVIDPYTKVNVFLYIISVLPILSAYFVPAMMIIGQANIIQIIISIMLLVISIPVVFNICGKAFKNGLLDYTKTNKKKNKTLSLEDQQSKYINKRIFSKIGLIIGMTIIIVVSAQLIGSLLFSLLIEPLISDYFDETTLSLFMQIIMQVLSLSLAYKFVKMCTSNETKKEVSKEPKTPVKKWQLTLMALSFVYIFNLLLSLVIYPMLGLDYDMTSLFNISSNSPLITKIISFITLAIIPGIFEELLFRKGLIDLLKPHGKKFAIILSALIFALVHLNISQGFFAFGVGLVFGIIYLLTDDIKLTMIIHTINNGLAAISVILPESALLVISSIIIVLIIIGVYYLVKAIIKFRLWKKLKPDWLAIKYNLSSKYKYLLYDFAFDVSLILIIVLSMLTENSLKSLLQ